MIPLHQPQFIFDDFNKHRGKKIFEEKQTMKTMIAICGLDCEKCNAYLATIHDDQALRKKTAKL